MWKLIIIFMNFNGDVVAHGMLDTEKVYGSEASCYQAGAEWKDGFGGARSWLPLVVICEEMKNDGIMQEL